MELLVKLAATDFKDDMRAGAIRWFRGRLLQGSFGLGGCWRRSFHVCGRRLTFYFLAQSRLRFLNRALSLFRGTRTQLGFVPMLPAFRHLVLNFNLSRLVGVAAVVNLGVDEGKAYFGHAGRLAVARAGKDHVFHAGTAQRFGGLFA